MGKFYFFTDIDLLAEQTSNESFGPAGTHSENGVTYEQFRITDIHTATTDTNAYAVCDGVILVQQDSANSNLVNLVLKPMQQTPFAFPKIKFFIYRGIKKDSLINGIEVAPSATNDLTESIWDSQSKRNSTNEGTNESPPKEALGIDITGNVSIDEIFFRINVDFQLPVVKAGWTIGKCNKDKFGFEILTESVGFDPKLDDVRMDEFFIRVQQLSNAATQAEEFEHWHDKEAILNYIDPCAFWGNFYNFKIKVFKNGSAHTYKKDQIYDEILVAVHLAETTPAFYNHNKIYLDIRNEINQSFNYFKNYGTDIKIAFDSSSNINSLNFYSNGWPLLILDSSNSQFPSNTSDNSNDIRISMPDGNGDNPLPLMYVSTGFLKSIYPREPKEQAKMIDLGITSGWTDEISLSIPNREGLVGTTAVSCYIRLKYFKRFDPDNPPPPSSGTVLRAQNYLEQLFISLDLKLPFAYTSVFKIAVFAQELYIDANSDFGFDCIANIGVAESVSSVYYFSVPQIIRSTEFKKKKYLQFENKTSDIYQSIIDYLLSEIKEISVHKTQLKFFSGDVTIAKLSFDNQHGQKFTDNTFEQIFIVGIKKDIISSFSSLFDNNFKIYIGAYDKIISQDNIGQDYIQHQLALNGYVQNSNIIEISQYLLNANIYTKLN